MEFDFINRMNIGHLSVMLLRDSVCTVICYNALTRNLSLLVAFWFCSVFWSLFWKVEGTVCIHVSHIHTRESHTATRHGNYLEGGGGIPNIGKLGKFEKLKI